LFVRSIGEVTDIVEKEMYTFVDALSEESLTLRPEGTASCVRAAIEHNLLYQSPQRLWYGGPMFRHERPQKGRYRQFHQFGVEALGFAGPDIDVEHMVMCARLWRLLSIGEVQLELNTLGSAETRARYRERLVAYLEQHRSALDADSARRLHANPLRVLDSKNPQMQELIRAAPSLLDDLDDASRVHFEGLTSLLDRAGVGYVINPRLVRGLDYYTRTVFEWLTDRLGAQSAVCAGGRYDGLVELLGGKPTQAVGFAIGLERLVELLRQDAPATADDTPHVCVIPVASERAGDALLLAERLRDRGLRVECQYAGSLKSGLKRADKIGARYAVLLEGGDAAAVKDLRGDEGQRTMTPGAVAEYLAPLLLTGRQ
ncbi:MAG: histidine--tRNA ligase, partial [Sulfurifustis sp.]